VYVDAPNAASGPLPADVPSDIFKGPYFEWWNAQQVGLLQTACHHASLGHYLEKHCLSRVTLLCHGWLGQDPKTKEILRYEGWDASLAFIKDYIALHGPFDGFWAFSQAREVREQRVHDYDGLSAMGNVRCYCSSVDQCWFCRAQFSHLFFLR
jgi:hypothetical protein